MTMKKQKGFTLIELVVVIVILGILAVTAAPKFLDLQDEAKTSAVYGLAGGMRGALAMTYAQAIVEGQDKEEKGIIKVEGVDVELIGGYPKNATELAKVVTGLEDWNPSPENVSAEDGGTVYGFDNFNCAVEYVLPKSSTTDGVTTFTAAKVNVIGSECERVGEQDSTTSS